MALELCRRRFITGLVSIIAAPAIVRIESLMPVKALIVEAPASPLWPLAYTMRWEVSVLAHGKWVWRCIEDVNSFELEEGDLQLQFIADIDAEQGQHRQRDAGDLRPRSTSLGCGRWLPPIMLKGPKPVC